uniref:Uncharacterized protein n=1 Tax=Romanomermis culicivorax TaxID=13658 RepID=A0A915JL89_ROMCU
MGFTVSALNAQWVAPSDAVLATLARCVAGRLLALKHGLISPLFSTPAHHVYYNKAIVDNADQVRGYLNAWATVQGGEMNRVIQALITGIKFVEPHTNDYIVMLTFGFRTGGHHFTNDMEAMYDPLWGRAIPQANKEHVEWGYYFTVGLHDIVPDFLDIYWLTAVARGQISRTLAMCVHCAAAGIALWKATKVAADDLLSCLSTQNANSPIINAMNV